MLGVEWYCCRFFCFEVFIFCGVIMLGLKFVVFVRLGFCKIFKFYFLFFGNGYFGICVRDLFKFFWGKFVFLDEFSCCLELERFFCKELEYGSNVNMLLGNLKGELEEVLIVVRDEGLWLFDNIIVSMLFIDFIFV